MKPRPRYIFKSELGKLLVTNLFNAKGNETTNIGTATSLVAILPNGKWFAAQCYPDELEYLQ